MIHDIAWRTFEKTGDLHAYLLLKELELSSLEESDKKQRNYPE